MSFRRIFTTARRMAGFTLVELLVVIGIIALLISILLPSLNSARRAAQTIKCAANLRSMMQSVQIYAAQYNNWLLGSTMTTGGFMFNKDGSEYKDSSGNIVYSNTNLPDLIQSDDWMCPIADVMRIKFDHGASSASRLSRFNQLCAAPQFTCPSNNFITVPFGTALAGAVASPLISYNSNLNLLFPYYGFFSGSATAFSASSTGVVAGNMQYSTATDTSYVPKLNRVGDASRKLLFADGSRYSNTTTAPDFGASAYGTGGGIFGTIGGACQVASNSFNRLGAPGNGTLAAGATDSRIYWARHGTTKQFLTADSYRANAAFIDGHVETMGDLQIADPNIWFPKNFVVQTTGGGAFANDVMKTYLPSSTATTFSPSY